MNTTPSTSSALPVAYTVIGGARWDRVRRWSHDLTFLVLSRGDRLFRGELLAELRATGAGEIVWVGGPGASYDLEAQAREFPDVRFLVLGGPATPGERVNIGISEARAPRVFCLWSDARVVSLPADLADRSVADPPVCTVPLARTPRGEAMPTLQAPRLVKGRVALDWRAPARDGGRTLFPFDFCGVYDVERFDRLGGYSAAVASPHWQKLDFGFRAHLWGETLRCRTGLVVAYATEPPADDATPDASYKQFWLRNLAVRRRRDAGELPAWRLAEYMLRSDTGPLYAVKEFRAAREWVRQNRWRYRVDPRDLVAGWERA
jgi:hypothetical protein